jgi:hypothetical protein
MLKNCVIAGLQVNSEAYHTQKVERGTPKFIMSPSSLKLFNECPARWIAGYNPPDSDAKAFGSLLDTLALTPSQFPERYAVKPATYKDAKTGEEKPFNMNATICKTWASEQEGKVIVSNGDYVEAQTATKRLMADETIAELINCSDKQVHVAGEWHDKPTSLVIPVQCLIDLAPKADSPFQKSLCDLKTVRNASQRPFARQVFQFGWHVQAALDLALYGAATGQDRTDWLFVALENYPPFQTGRRLLAMDFIEIGQQTFKHALGRYAKCLKTGVWPSYDPAEEFSLVQAEPWMQFEAMGEAMEHQVEEEMAENNDVPTP